MRALLVPPRNAGASSDRGGAEVRLGEALKHERQKRSASRRKTANIEASKVNEGGARVLVYSRMRAQDEPVARNVRPSLRVQSGRGWF
jgi:hypothetical protein